ncbi:ste ste11 protein kinase [Moniliophthora roreri]|nr:ste ste11 protein kinase [Moniliophthora roreri]
MPPPRAHDAHPVSPPLSGFIAELGIDAEHNKRWIELFPRAVRRLELLVLIYGNISVRTAGHSFGHGLLATVLGMVNHSVSP